MNNYGTCIKNTNSKININFHGDSFSLRHAPSILHADTCVFCLNFEFVRKCGSMHYHLTFYSFFADGLVHLLLGAVLHRPATKISGPAISPHYESDLMQVVFALPKIVFWRSGSCVLIDMVFACGPFDVARSIAR